jgi:hypothetical protein
MKIDDPIAANILTVKISDAIPFQAFLGKSLLKISERDGHKTDSETPFDIDWAAYSGDEGGIMCALKNTLENGEMYVASITQIKIDPEHPLAPEIESYQQERIKKLAIQNRGEFFAELLERSPKPKSKSRKRGFGQL